MKLVFDVDDTLCYTDPSVTYLERKPKLEVIEKLKEYKKKYGCEIIICTGRQQRTYNKNIGKRNVYTLPILIEWLKKYDIPFDEIWLEKPWQGKMGFRVDDSTIRPREFVNLTYREIIGLLERDK
jgi:capsule biosynthesis phosphatase